MNGGDRGHGDGEHGDRECGDRECGLADLAPGDRAVVVAVEAGATPSVARRLGDLGFMPGTEVEVVRRAPLRDPVVYRVRDYEVCLRRAQAETVRVTRTADVRAQARECGPPRVRQPDPVAANIPAAGARR